MTLFYWCTEFFVCFIEAFLCFTFCDLFVPAKKSVIKEVLISSIIALIVVLLNSYSLMSPLLTAFILLMYFSSQYYTRRKKPLRILLSVFLYFVILFLFDYVFLFVISFLAQVNIEYLTENMSVLRTVTTLCSKTVLFIFLRLISKIVAKNNFYSQKREYIFMLLAFISTMFSTIMYAYLITNKDTYSKFFLLSCFMGMIMMILAFFFVMDYVQKDEQKKQEFYFIEQQNELLERGLKEQEKTFALWQQSIHDYKHKIAMLDTLANNKQFDKIHDILSQEMEKFNDKAFYISTGNKVLDVIINSKMNVAKENKVNFTFNIKLDGGMKIEDIDLCIMLGNLLDNAIEASKDEYDPIIHVSIGNKNNFFVIKVINKYSKSEIKLGTSKENPAFHGIGLKSVKNIVKKYDGNFYIGCENGYVSTIITI